SFIFLFAGMIGYTAFHRRFSTVPLSRKEWGFGILLGIPNFYSIYFMMLALQFELPGSVFFPVLNCGVIVLSALSGHLLFREPINRFQVVGILLSTISIFLITYFKS
ncbi:MAG TPA: EamA family transporter, partial [Saprospiraceae bacterium]|nr:EamA family transporter [Saprospiraceae bacterium]